MRIRAIKPEFWRSQDISNLDIETRLLFIGLWSYVDDNGVGQDRDALIAADLFADDMSRHPRDTLARIHRGLEALHETEMISRYTVDGRHFLHVTSWEKHQRIDRPNKPRYPLPTSENAEIATPSRHPREDSSTGTGEVGTGEVGTGEQVSLAQPAVERAFDSFWHAYPRKVGKQKARTKFAAALKRADADTITAGAYRLAADPNLPEKQFIPHPTTWLERDGWDDEPLPARTAARGREEKNLAVLTDFVHRAAGWKEIS